MLSILDVLMDEDDRDPIRLADSEGRELLFEQVAVIPYEEKIYCILKPITRIEGVAEDEAIVFYVEESPDAPPVLMVEHDELKAIEVFEAYYDLLEEEDD